MARIVETAKGVTVEVTSVADGVELFRTIPDDYEGPGAKEWPTTLDVLKNQQKWTGVPKHIDSIEKYAEFFASGWPEGIRKMSDAMDHIKAPVVKSVRRRGAWAREGDELSRDRLYAGAIDTMWRTTTRVATASPARVRIIVDICSSGSVHASNLFWRGAAGATLARIMTEAGYAVKLVAISSANCYENGATGTIITTVKDWSQPLNVSAVVAAVACMAYARLITYGIMKGKQGKHRTRFGLGNVRPAQITDLAPEGNARTFLVGQYILSQESANTWVADAVKQLEA